MAQEGIRRRWTDRLDGPQLVVSITDQSYAMFLLESVCCLSPIYPCFPLTCLPDWVHDVYVTECGLGTDGVLAVSGRMRAETRVTVAQGTERSNRHASRWGIESVKCTTGKSRRVGSHHRECGGNTSIRPSPTYPIHVDLSAG